jgi:hypothetical protein
MVGQLLSVCFHSCCGFCALSEELLCLPTVSDYSQYKPNDIFSFKTCLHHWLYCAVLLSIIVQSTFEGIVNGLKWSFKERCCWEPNWGIILHKHIRSHQVKKWPARRILCHSHDQKPLLDHSLMICNQHQWLAWCPAVVLR